MLGGALAIGVVTLGAAGGAYASWQSSGAIAPSVHIAGIDIGGLSKTEASAQIARHFGDFPLKLTLGDRNLETSLRELGGRPSIDFTVAKAAKVGRDGSVFANFLQVYGTKTTGERLMLPVVWDKAALVKRLRDWDRDYAVKAKNARLKFGESGIEVISGQSGRRLNIGATAAAIQKRYFVGTTALKAYARSVAPAIDAADLQGADKLLASYKTRFNRGLEGRTANIRVACAAIDGHILMPGERFSFNAMTGERTWKKGYRMAHIFETKPGAKEAEVVDGLAGGVCQVSSTLFNAVRRANDETRDQNGAKLKILERNSHSLPVTYVPSGLDATVAWPYKDFRFRNTFSHPVFLRTTIRGSQLTIGVWGHILNSQPTLKNAMDT